MSRRGQLPRRAKDDDGDVRHADHGEGGREMHARGFLLRAQGVFPWMDGRERRVGAAAVTTTMLGDRSSSAGTGGGEETGHWSRRASKARRGTVPVTCPSALQFVLQHVLELIHAGHCCST